MYTVLGSCRLAGVDPIEYLADVLPKLTRRIGNLIARPSRVLIVLLTAT